MRQKIGIVQALQHDPELAILDEPSEGLDPLMQRAFYEILDTLKAEGRTIFFSSHVLSEVERVCDRVAIVRQGRLVALEETAATPGQAEAERADALLGRAAAARVGARRVGRRASGWSGEGPHYIRAGSKATCGRSSRPSPAPPSRTSRSSPRASRRRSSSSTTRAEPQ